MWQRALGGAVLLAVATTLCGCGEEVVAPECSSFNKNGVAPVTDSMTCRTACQTAEGLSEINGQLQDWKGSSGSGKCECVTNANGGRRTACQDSGYSA
mmetsp:Transcript_69616/g.166110  ORF Transcript_69616/g.166110 Transcript_69616/m.166110 type:complete len:98 (+) Transcript_69616:38-331(+)